MMMKKEKKKITKTTTLTAVPFDTAGGISHRRKNLPTKKEQLAKRKEYYRIYDARYRYANIDRIREYERIRDAEKGKI